MMAVAAVRGNSATLRNLSPSVLRCWRRKACRTPAVDAVVAASADAPITVAAARTIIAEHKARGRCRICKRPLTDPAQVAAGIGLCCAARMVAQGGEAQPETETAPATPVAYRGSGPARRWRAQRDRRDPGPGAGRGGKVTGWPAACNWSWCMPKRSEIYQPSPRAARRPPPPDGSVTSTWRPTTLRWSRPSTPNCAAGWNRRECASSCCSTVGPGVRASPSAGEQAAA